MENRKLACMLNSAYCSNSPLARLFSSLFATAAMASDQQTWVQTVHILENALTSVIKFRTTLGEERWQIRWSSSLKDCQWNYFSFNLRIWWWTDTRLHCLTCKFGRRVHHGTGSTELLLNSPDSVPESHRFPYSSHLHSVSCYSPLSPSATSLGITDSHNLLHFPAFPYPSSLAIISEANDRVIFDFAFYGKHWFRGN